MHRRRDPGALAGWGERADPAARVSLAKTSRGLVVTKNGEQSPAADADGLSGGEAKPAHGFDTENGTASSVTADAGPDHGAAESAVTDAGANESPPHAAEPPSPARSARDRHLGIRRVPKPRLRGFLDSPHRNLILGILYTLTVMMAGTAAYMIVGWSLRDAFYMVITTVYTVGFEEVRPINTPALYVITVTLIVLGCTGVIFLTGALVQFFTLSTLNKAIGIKRMNKQIDQLSGHVVVCGFGRLGSVLARSLAASSAGFVIIEPEETRAVDAREQGYLCIHGDATSEKTLLAAGITRAAALASVVSADALNVFITLSARALNPGLTIVARGELASTESKLIQAGADKVVLPTHIGAERVAELLLFQESARIIEGLERSHGFQRVLRSFGIELEVVTAAPQSPAVRMTVDAIERQARGAFFIVQINRRDGDVHTGPPGSTVVGEGDGVVLIGRPNRAAVLTSLFEPRRRVGVRG
jgi:voltage-gated potassium channel